MIERGLGEQSRFITYVLLIGRALSTLAEYRQLADYRRPADFRQLPEYRQPAEFRRQFDEERPQTLSDVQRGRLSQAADHLRRAARAHASLDVAAGQGLPDLEAVQIYQSVYEAVALAGIRAGDRVAETIAGLIATLDRIVEGAPVAGLGGGHLLDPLAGACSTSLAHCSRQRVAWILNCRCALRVDSSSPRQTPSRMPKSRLG